MKAFINALVKQLGHDLEYVASEKAFVHGDRSVAYEVDKVLTRAAERMRHVMEDVERELVIEYKEKRRTGLKAVK